ncbi:TPA: DNA phosphorothioation-associated protein 4 [Vibrio parahaemolyticus]|uniref:DNA phosphorothioation-associated protein 4 n=1 Tax=Vibrio alginolyticus TaxID=663 RepID=UPI001BD1D42E|nr:DNA phosphorothioation-associated protein 4 [Vibrio alginolyticus]MBS9955708.1 DNA phosphorothioation-associated protein 4 [Vibrio alginolyticus]HCH2708207.1 DNA phosphorothioation-associated protein 4 [Vibrio parahaemolyticus]
MGSLDGKRVRRPVEYDDLLNSLVREEKIFSTLKNALVFAASVGYKKQIKLEFKESSEPIKLPVFDRDQDIPFMYALALAETDDIKMMREDQFDQVIQIFEEYAHGGLSFIKSVYDPASSVQSLEQLVSEYNNSSDEVSDIFNELFG